jgi:hypothetical protein
MQRPRRAQSRDKIDGMHRIEDAFIQFIVSYHPRSGAEMINWPHPPDRLPERLK